MRIENAVAVVTGGASGIGRGIAEQFIEAGACVVIADIQEDAMHRTAAEIGATGFQVNVADAESVQRLADSVLERFGHVDILVNNAGVGPLGSIDDLTLDDWKWVLDVNLWGVIHGIKSFLPILKDNPNGGHIVNTGSMASFVPPEGLGAYSVSKFGVAALTEVLRKEMISAELPIEVTLLAPGPVHSNIQSSSRNRPAGQQGGLKDVDIAEGLAADDRWSTPQDVGRIVMRAIRNDDPYALTHPDWLVHVTERSDEIRAAFEKYPVLGTEAPADDAA